jgi:hypothetical protein
MPGNRHQMRSNPPASAAAPPRGKAVAGRLYLHVSALDSGDAASGETEMPTGVAERLAVQLARAERLTKLRRGEHFNRVRLDADGDALALLGSGRGSQGEGLPSNLQVAEHPAEASSALPRFCFPRTIKPNEWLGPTARCRAVALLSARQRQRAGLGVTQRWLRTGFLPRTSPQPVKELLFWFATPALDGAQRGVEGAGKLHPGQRYPSRKAPESVNGREQTIAFHRLWCCDVI